MTSTKENDNISDNINDKQCESSIFSGVCLSDIDDFIKQTELNHIQNNVPLVNDDIPASCLDDSGSCAVYSTLNALVDEEKLPDEDVIYIISKNAQVYKCDVCDIHYSNIFDLTKHKRLHTKTFNCHLCNDRFSNTYGLSRHLLRTHRREKRHQCLECGKAFQQQGHLIAHTRVHTGEKPYICTVCQKPFAHYANLITHRKVHGKERPYQCEICTKQFVRASNLIEHRKIHNGIKPFECDMCENKYKRNSHLIEHKRIHTGEKPYKCDLCEERFPRCSDLNKHKKRHHK